MIVADDELSAMETALLKGGEEVAPVGLCFAQGDADAQDGTVARDIDADGHEDGAIEDDTVAADLFVAGIEDEIRIGELGQGTVAPEIEFLIELSGGAADLGRGDLQGAGELAKNGGDSASGNALDVHFGNGESQSAFAALTALESRGIKIELAADLRDIDGQFAQAGLKGLWLETIGVAFASGGTLIRGSAERF